MPVPRLRRANRSLLQRLRPDLLAILAVVATPGLDRVALAQTVDPGQYVTNGTVSAQVVVGNTLYLGGSFGSVGAPTGSFATVDATTGAGLPSFPKVAGSVNAIVADGAGGWFIGGQFNSVGGLPRANLAHVLADNSVASWDPAPNFTVQSLALDGTTLYVGGQFNLIGGLPRGGLATVDASTGAIGTWNPGAGGQFTAIAVAGGTVYVGGFFTTVGGQPRGSIAAIDAATGLATAWNPGANSNVFTLVPAGSTIYAGGAFTSIGGQARSKIAALDAATGLATAWNPNAGPAGAGFTVRALAVDGGTVYTGGSFTSIGGQPRNRLAALDAATGLATAWDPNANLDVRAIQVDGGNVYVGGLFSFVGGQQRNRAAALDAATGLATAWNPDCAGNALALARAPSVVALGGSFTGLAFTPRSSLAAIDLTTGQVTGWNPGGINGNVLSLASDGTSLYVGGLFTIVGAQTRNRIAEVDLVTGLPTAWNPNASGQVSALVVNGTSVHAGGAFTSIGGQTRNRIAEIDRATGSATAWDPNANNTVSALAVDGGTVYAGGFFTGIGGQPRNRIAALDRATGLATAWDPNAADGTVASLAVRGGAVYAGGAFGNIGGQPRARVAAIDAATGLATSWNANAGGANMTAVAVSSSAVYVGGSIFSMGADPRNGIAALDPATGGVLSWCATGSGGTGNVNSLVLAGSSVFAGGSFLSMQAVPVGFLARIEAVPTITHTLVVASEPVDGGAVLRNPDQPVYETATPVELTAAPAEGYRFLNWSGDLSGSTNPQTLVMDGSKTVTALYESLLFTITTSSTAGGRISPSGPVVLTYGEEQSFSIIPFAGHTLVDVLVDGSSRGPVRTVFIGSVDANHTIHAEFMPHPYAITTSAGPGGAVHPVGTVPVAEGSTPTITVAPYPGYRVAEVLVDGVPIGPLGTYRFDPIAADHSVVASFVPSCGLFLDEFEGELEPGWTIGREVPEAWSLTGGQLYVIPLIGSLALDVNFLQNFFVRPAPSGDFVIATRVVGDDGHNFIALYADDDNYLSLIHSSSLIVHLESPGAGMGAVVSESADTTLFLAIAKVGNSAAVMTSQDGSDWIILSGIPDLPFVPTHVGLASHTPTVAGDDGLVTFEFFGVWHGLSQDAISGVVTGTCNGTTDGLHGVTVDLFATGEDEVDVLVASAATDASGAYSFPGVTPGTYTATLVTPLGYYTATPTLVIGGCGDNATAGAFDLNCIPVTAQPRAMGYWKHQVNVYLSGKGNAQETLDALVGYIGLIVQHFNENIVNPVIVYVPGAASAGDQLLQLQQLLTLNKGGSHLDRAKQQLLSLLLNVVSAKIHQTQVISGNGATVSQAITFCYDLIVDGDPANDATAKTIAETINDGQQVPSGMVPSGTRVITYDLKPAEPEVAFGIRALPNPVRGALVVELGLAGLEPAALELIDIAGRRVWRQAVAGTGRQAVRAGDGQLASGVYRLRLRQGDRTATRTVVVTR